MLWLHDAEIFPSVLIHGPPQRKTSQHQQFRSLPCSISSPRTGFHIDIELIAAEELDATGNFRDGSGLLLVAIAS